ncbi:MAG: lipoyl(octanoyl) transferase LipB [Nitrospirae bacterium]|nr:MAG: lipoyl(octanoyl) transferase LipB [Nitrospirota bacterium]
MSGPGLLLVYDRLDYAAAWDLQRRLVEERVAGRRPDTLVLVEHEPVFTVGRSGQAAHWGEEQVLREAGYSLYHVERGGSVTYHGPGQIVGYPILRLSRFCPGPKAYVRLLEDVLIRTLADWGIAGQRVERLPGVWVGEEPAKIAALGVRIVKGVTMHGFALNVTVDLAPFHRIVPCGITGCRVTSMAALLGTPVEVAMVRKRVAEKFAEVFGLDWTEGNEGCAAVPLTGLSGEALEAGVAGGRERLNSAVGMGSGGG